MIGWWRISHASACSLSMPAQRIARELNWPKLLNIHGRIAQKRAPNLDWQSHWNTSLLRYSGCVVECRICNWEVAGSNLGLGHFAPRSTQPSIPPGSVNIVIAGKAKAGMAHSDCGWTCGRAGKTVKSLVNTCHTWALLQWWFTTKRRYIKCMDLTSCWTCWCDPGRY